MTNEANAVIEDDGAIELGIRLRNARDKKKLSRRELQDITGISQKVIANYENGTQEQSVFRLRTLADALDVPFDLLIGGEMIDEEESIANDDAPEYELDDDDFLDHHDAEEIDKAVRIEDAINLLQEIDEIRLRGFQLFPRRAASMIDSALEHLRTLEPAEIIEVAKHRELFLGKSDSFLDILGIFTEDFDKAQKYCGLIEERIVDTAIFGIDLYFIEEEPLIELIEELDIDHPNEFALPILWSWGDHEFFVPYLRPVLRSSALAGQVHDLTDMEKFPRREQDFEQEESNS